MNGSPYVSSKAAKARTSAVEPPAFRVLMQERPRFGHFRHNFLLREVGDPFVKEGHLKCCRAWENSFAAYRRSVRYFRRLASASSERSTNLTPIPSAFTWAVSWGWRTTPSTIIELVEPGRLTRR